MLQRMSMGRRRRLDFIILACFCVVSLFSYPSLGSAQEQALTASLANSTVEGNGLTVNPASKRISIDYNEANLVSVLKALAYSFDLNLVMTKDGTGKVSAHLQNITVDEALNAILTVNGYRFVRKNAIIYVMNAKEVEAVAQPFHLSFLIASDAKQLLSKTISSTGDIQINEASNSLVVVADVFVKNVFVSGK